MLWSPAQGGFAGEHAIRQTIATTRRHCDRSDASAEAWGVLLRACCRLPQYVAADDTGRSRYLGGWLASSSRTAARPSRPTDPVPRRDHQRTPAVTRPNAQPPLPSQHRQIGHRTVVHNRAGVDTG